MAETLALAPDVRGLVERLRALEPELRGLGVTRLAMFGSRARGDHREDSDVDLLVDVHAGGKFSLFDLIGVGHLVKDRLGLVAHLEMRRSLRPEFARRIEPHIVEIF
jgi:predicted nucleotidyltransferase